MAQGLNPAYRQRLRSCLIERSCGIDRDAYLSYWLVQLGGLMEEW
jgi:hypothetical protein